jgi:hypothetical protein
VQSNVVKRDFFVDDISRKMFLMKIQTGNILEKCYQHRIQREEREGECTY